MFYRNYHSQRYVHGEFVIRMQRPLTADQVEALNNEFAKLVEEGRIRACSALEDEQEHLDLPRLRFIYTRRDYGTLRLLIDRINEFDAQNHPRCRNENICMDAKGIVLRSRYRMAQG